METAIPKGWKLIDPNSNLLSTHGQNAFLLYGGEPDKYVKLKGFVTYHWIDGQITSREHPVFGRAA